MENWWDEVRWGEEVGRWGEVSEVWWGEWRGGEGVEGEGEGIEGRGGEVRWGTVREYQPAGYSSYSLLQLAVSTSLTDAGTLFGTVSETLLNLPVPIMWQTKFHTHITGNQWHFLRDHAYSTERDRETSVGVGAPLACNACDPQGMLFASW